MIKAYFFDWMNTIGNVANENVIGTLIPPASHDSLLIEKFENADLPKDKRKEIFQYITTTNLNLYPDSEEVINCLKSNYKLAIVSNMYEITARRIRRQFPTFLNKFNVVTLSFEVGMKKPDWRIFLYTLNALNETCRTDISLSEVMMVGDLQVDDINPAIQLGMQARLINRTKQNLVDVI